MKYYQYRMNIKLLNWLSIILFIPAFFIISLLKLWNYIDIYFLVIYFLWMFLHEVFHGIGFAINKNINCKNIVYGACLEKGILYCMCKQKISKRDIMISLIFPFIFIGVITFFIGIIFNNQLLILLSLFNIIGSIGDLVMFFSFLKLPDFYYVDQNDCTGFVLISSSDFTKYKLFGIDLLKSGVEANLELSNNCKKITISKLSWIIFIILIILLIAHIFYY